MKKYHSNKQKKGFFRDAKGKNKTSITSVNISVRDKREKRDIYSSKKNKTKYKCIFI
jgi:hypothetical protein